MAFDQIGAAARIAVIGGGISGLGAAHALAGRGRVTLFEAEKRLGGHARTVWAGPRRDVAVDTGFIVFNRVNYPHLCRLFEALGVPVKNSGMSFGFSLDGGRLEYGLRDLWALSCQPSNWARPAFLGMIRDVLRFNRGAMAAARPGLTLGGMLDEMGLGRAFREWYLLPLSGAIWSAPSRAMLDFPAQSLVGFFANHNLLQTSGQHQWLTVDGGSIAYLRRLEAALRRQGAELRLGAGVKSLRRAGGLWLVRAEGMEEEAFDAVVMACHAPQARALLADHPAGAALAPLRTQPNRMALHRDARWMPRRRGAWAAWNHLSRTGAEGEAIVLTYWMNRLQGLPQETPLFVTLNPTSEIPVEMVYDEAIFAHPVFDAAALEARARVAALQGRDDLWLCGAWLGHGFHEDGLASGLAAARAMGAAPAWATL